MLREKTVLFYWQRKVVQSIKSRGANNCGTHGFVKKKKFFKKINNFRFPLSTNLVANYTPISTLTARVHQLGIHRIRLRPSAAQRDGAIQKITCLIQATLSQSQGGGMLLYAAILPILC